MGTSLARTGPGSIPTASILSVSAKPRSTRRDARWATSSATPYASAWRTRCSPPAKASRPCCRCAACCQPCQWPPRSRPTTSPPFCSRRHCGGSIARDNDAAGEVAGTALAERAESAGIETLVWSPRRGDFNEDLRAFGLDAFRAALRVQLVPQDVARFMLLISAETG